MQTTLRSSQGAEEVFFRGYKQLGAPLINVANPMDLRQLARRISGIGKIEEFLRSIAP